MGFSNKEAKVKRQGFPTNFDLGAVCRFQEMQFRIKEVTLFGAIIKTDILLQIADISLCI